MALILIPVIVILVYKFVTKRRRNPPKIVLGTIDSKGNSTLRVKLIVCSSTVGIV